MKKILFVVDEKKMGGVSVLLEDILNMINISKYKIDILVLHNNGNMLSNIPNNINIIYGTKFFDTIDLTIKEVLKSKKISLFFRKTRLVFLMKTSLIKKKIIKERKKILKDSYDVEIAFKDGFTAIFTSCGNSKKKIHWVQYAYNSDFNPNDKYKKLFNDILDDFDSIVAVSKKVSEAFNHIYHLEEKTKIINNIIDTNKILKLSKEKNDLKLNNGNINFCLVGRIHSIKGYDRFLDVLNKLNEEKLLSNCKFTVFGDGPDYNKILERINNLKLNDIIDMKGFTSNPYKYIKDFDMFILPSLHESFGLVVVEAMTLNIPVLMTNTNASFELIDNDKNGLIVDNNFDGLYNGLKNIINDSNKIKIYKNNLRNYKYDNNRIIEQIESELD